MEAPDNLEVSKMVADAVRAAVAVQSDALTQMLADDAVATAEEKAAHAGCGSGMDDCATAGGGGSALWTYANGAWHQCPVQIGYNISDVAELLDAPTGVGPYRIAVNLSDGTVTLEQGNSREPDFSNNLVYFHVATFREEDGQLVQTWSVGAMPVAYMYA